VTASTPAVERAAEALWDANGAPDANPPEEFVLDAHAALTAALTDPDDPDSLARTLFTLVLVSNDPAWTVQGARIVWDAPETESTRLHWRAVAIGLRTYLTVSGA
jgi:hypothetical protein